MIRFALVACLGLLFAAAGMAQGQLISARLQGSAIDVISTTTGAQLGSFPITIPGDTIIGFRGLAMDPTTGTLYAVARLTTAGDDWLTTVNQTTGVLTVLGQMTEGIAGIQFTTAGQLYAITGDGALVPSIGRSLYTVNKANGACTLAHTTSVVHNAGEAIGFSPTNTAVMFHFGGSAPFEFDTVNLTTGAKTPIVASGVPAGLSITAFAWDSNSGAFYTAAASGALGRITAAGAYTHIGNMANVGKALVVVPTISSSTLNLNLGSTTQGTASTGVSFNVSGFNMFGPVTVTAPANVQVSLSLATGYGPSVNTAAPAASGQLASTQIFARISASAPVGPVSANITLSGTGALPVLVAVTGTVSAPPAPEMDVTRAANPIADGGTDNLGTPVAGTPIVLTYQIANSGTATLTLTVPVVPAGAVNCTPSVTAQPTASVAALANTTLAISVTPTAAGAFSFTVSIANNDANENPYNWTVSGNATAAPAPEMDVTRGANPVADGGADNVGSLVAGSASAAFTWTITNSGTAALTITTPIDINSPVNCNVNVTSQPTTSVAAAGNTTLVLTITPVAAGAFSFEVSIANNDANENPYNWTVSGMATPAPEPEMEVLRGAAPIADGGNDAVGQVVETIASTFTYTIENNGMASLTITTPITVSNEVNCAVTVTTQPGVSVAAAGSTTLVLDVTAAAPGAFSFDISIANNDANENPYNWTVSGTAVALEPEIAVERGVSITNGGNDAVNGTTAGTAVTLTYTISNSGTGPLAITLPVTLTGATNCTANVTTQPTATVAAAGSTTLVISLTPTSAGAFSVEVTIDNDDANENPYTWTANGTAAAAPTPPPADDDKDDDDGGCVAGAGASLLPVMALAALAALRRRRK